MTSPIEANVPPLTATQGDITVTNLELGVLMVEIQGGIAPEDCVELIRVMDDQGAQPGGPVLVGVSQVQVRSQHLADALWDKVKEAVFLMTGEVSSLPDGRIVCGDHFPTNWFADGERKEHRKWRAVGVSPVLRFTKYERGGARVGHYGQGVDDPENKRRSLASVTWNLTASADEDDGATRLLDDGQSMIQTSLRSHQECPKLSDYVLHVFDSTLGSASILWDGLCRDVSPYLGGGSKITLQADILFQVDEE